MGVFWSFRLLLENVPLSAYPRARYNQSKKSNWHLIGSKKMILLHAFLGCFRCNDNSVATYYRQGTELGPKVLIYLQGGGFCVPSFGLIPAFDCEQRCKDTP